QPAAYRDEVLPPDLGPRLAVETGVSLGWQPWLAPRGDILALDRCCAAAPGDRLVTEPGYTPQQLPHPGVTRLSGPRARPPAVRCSSCSASANRRGTTTSIAACWRTAASRAWCATATSRA